MRTQLRLSLEGEQVVAEPPLPALPTESSILIEALSELGINGPEQAVLMALLASQQHRTAGSATASLPASLIAKQTGISRAHIYELLERLRARGVVSVHERQGVRYFAAIPVDEMVLILEQREQSLAAHRRQLSAVLRSGPSTNGSLFEDPRTHSFRGPEAKARLFQELVRADTPRVYLFCSADESVIFDGAPPSFEALDQLHHLVSGELFVVLHSVDSRKTPKFLSSVPKSLSEKILIATTEQILSADMLVTGRRVSLLGTRGNLPHAIVFDQPALAQVLSQMAESLFAANQAPGTAPAASEEDI